MIALMVGERWKLPHWVPADVPKLAVKTAPWHDPKTSRFDWRVVAACTVLAIDVRGPDERADGPEGWDPWLWLLAQVQAYARDVQRFTITEEFHDPTTMLAPERELETYAWLCSRYVDGVFTWPCWWPHARRIFDRASAQELAA